MHGGKSTGPRTAEGKKRISDARFRSGKYTNEMKHFRQLLAEDLEMTRALLKALK